MRKIKRLCICGKIYILNCPNCFKIEKEANDRIKEGEKKRELRLQKDARYFNRLEQIEKNREKLENNVPLILSLYNFEKKHYDILDILLGEDKWNNLEYSLLGRLIKTNVHLKN